MRSKKNDKNLINQLNFEDEIELKPILEKILRNKFYIISFGFVSAFISALIAINTPKVWEGEFQIVFNEENKTFMKSSLQGLLLGRSSNNQLKTQIKILESPYVLMDIFQFVRKEKNDKDLTFKKWMKSLDIDNVEDTKVVRVIYTDSNKEILKKVLDKISKSYENYTIKKRNSDISIGMNFLDKQIKKYEVQSNEDYLNLQKFANQELLFVPTILNEEAIITNDQFQKDKINAFNTIKEIESNINQIQNIPIDSDSIFSKAILLNNSNNTLKNQNIPELDIYSENEIKLSNLRKIFKDNDLYINSLLLQKQNLRKKVREKLLNNLLAQKSLVEAKISSLNRSQNKLTSYSNLLRIALKSKKTLSELEKNYVQLAIEKNNNLNNTQIITKPTILPYPVAPNKKKMVIIGFISAIFFASFVSYIYEKNRKNLFSKYEVFSVLNDKLIENLYFDNPKEWTEVINLIFKTKESNSRSDFAFYQIGSINQMELNNLNDIFLDILGKDNFILSKQISEILEYKHLICLIFLGRTDKDQFKKEISRLQKIPNMSISYLTIE